jgi:hypothetical protein
MKITKNVLETLKSEGVIILPSFIGRDTLDIINKDIENSNYLSFNDRLGSLFISDNQWIDHLAVASKTALETVLNPDLLNLLDSYFNEEVVLGSFKYQKKLIGGKSIPLHRDRGPGLVMFIFLNDITTETGSTRFIKGSHLLKIDSIKHNDSDDAEYVHPEEYDFKIQSIQALGNKAGTVQIYSQNILHDLPYYNKAGRETIWAIYYPKSQAYNSEDHLIRIKNLINLTENQKKRILISEDTRGLSFTNISNNIPVTGIYKISNIRKNIYVIRYFLILLYNRFKLLFNLRFFRQKYKRDS